MKEGEKKVPELRFKGFTDNWEQRQLGEVAEIIGGGTPKTTVEEYWDGDINWYSPAEIGQNRFLRESKRKITELGLHKSSAKILPVGSVLFTSRAGIGNTAILLSEGSTNQGFQSIVPIENKLDTYFIYSLTHKLKRFGEVTGAGSTFVEVSGKQMKKMPLMLPKLDEQQKIGSLLKFVDHTTALHQRKVDSLKRLKSASYQRVFPRKDKKTPQFRFGNFNMSWLETKIEQLFSERNTRSSEGELLSVTINSGVVKQESLDRKSNVSSDKSNYKRVRINDIPYNSMRMWQGASGISPYSGIVSPAYTVLSPRVGISPLFFSFYFKHSELIHKFKINSQGLTSDTWNLKYPILKDIEIKVPEYQEQIEISTYFSRLDLLIEVSQKKVDQLSMLKKVYLNKMFV